MKRLSNILTVLMAAILSAGCTRQEPESGVKIYRTRRRKPVFSRSYEMQQILLANDI